MDDLWDPPNYQATKDTHCGNNDGCKCALCLTNDVVEETALNEISCIEVLRILISKEDSDIIELEDELMELLSQLVCNDEELSNMYSMWLKREIDFLDGSIRKLKDNDEDFLSTRSRKPAENMVDIFDSLFCRYMQKKDKQSADNINNIASSSCQVHLDIIPFKDKKQTSSSSNANQIEKNKTIINTSLEKQKISHTKVKTEQLEDPSYPMYTALCEGSMEKWKHQLVKIKPQTDEESIGSKSTLSIESSIPNTQINVSLSTKIYKRRQKLNSPSHTSSTSPCLLLEGADVANMCNGLEMDYYTVDELRAIAKQRGMRGYTKLRKMELAQTLGINILEGRRKQKKKETLALTWT